MKTEGRKTVPTAKAHHYAIDAACLLEKCLTLLRETIEQTTHGRHKALFDMEEALVNAERLLHAYIIQLIALEHETIDEDASDHVPPTLSECIETLQAVLEAKKQKQRWSRQVHEVKRSRSRARNKKKRQREINESVAVDWVDWQEAEGKQDASQLYQPALDSSRSGAIQATFDQSRSATDSLLFRLIVALQLCLVRVDDARFVITGYRYQEDLVEASWSPVKTGIAGTVKIGIAGTICMLGFGSIWMLRSKIDKPWLRMDGILRFSGKIAAAAFAGKLIVREWGNVWMTAKIMKSIAAIEEWQQQWLFIQTTGDSSSCYLALPDAKSQRLIVYALSQSPKSSLWHSEGEIRFLLLKRAMDLLYASVGTAVEATKDTEATKQGKASWKLPLTAAAAASYYSLTGPSRRAHEAVSSSSLRLIQYAWGMVSLPAIKQLSLRASRLLKGAAIAERVTIAGVPCFILSRDPLTDLAASILREQRREKRVLHTLTTIEEKSEGESSPSLDAMIASRKIMRPCRAYKKQDVILHLTGGGFFAHTIASDVPFLLDWSGTANAVVICPEYSLLPEHTFPVALNEVVDVYCSLVSGAAADLLGIDVDRVIVTGESAGGNLAVSLCVKLCVENLVDVNALMASKHRRDDSSSSEIDLSSRAGGLEHETGSTIRGVRLPDAIMLSCPALNLTLELSPSRVLGNEDPVLPSGLITAISDAYIPPALGVSKKDPLASPFYAPDDVIRLFPPTLIYAGSDDPLLDDSIYFNKRLQSHGVESELRAASHMPHAYWGLGTAGFPEAKQVQHECEEWLVRQLAR